MPSASGGGRRCTSRIARCSDTCGTRAATTTGIASSRGTPELDEFRSLFGDERADYAAALSTHYEHGAPADWQERFVSAYASSHPWEDWAETWAHYLHMVDTLETAAACGLSLKPRRRDEPALPTMPQPVSPQPAAFDV